MEACLHFEVKFGAIVTKVISSNLDRKAIIESGGEDHAADAKVTGGVTIDTKCLVFRTSKAIVGGGGNILSFSDDAADEVIPKDSNFRLTCWDWQLPKGLTVMTSPPSRLLLLAVRPPQGKTQCEPVDRLRSPQLLRLLTLHTYRRTCDSCRRGMKHLA